MSIVDKTLQRLGKPEGVAAEMPSAAPTSLPHDLLYVTGAHRKRQRPVALWLGGVFLAGGVAAWFLIPDLVAVPPAPTSAPIIAQPAPVAPPVVAEPATVLAAAPEAKPAPADEAQPAPLAEAKPAPLAESRPASVPEPKPVPIQEAKPAPEAKPVPAVAVKPAAIPEAKPAPVAKPAPLVSPDWLREGWVAMSAAKAEQALSIWEAGLRSLPDQQPLIVGFAFLDRHGMNTALARRDPDWAAFAIREGHFRRGGEPHYRLVVLTPSPAPTGFNADVSALFGRADKVSAGYMKRRLLAENAAAAVVPAPTAGPTKSPEPPKKEVPQLVQKAAQKESPKAAAMTSEAVAPPPPIPPREDRRDWDGRADTIRDQLRQGAFGPAAEGAEKLSRDFPGRWEPLHWLGTAQLGLGRLGEAENALERATALNPNAPHVWIQRAVAAQERQNHAAAISHLLEAEKLAPRMPEIFLNKGFSHDALGQTNDANKSFSRFLTLTEGNPVYAIQRKHIENRLNR